MIGSIVIILIGLVMYGCAEKLLLPEGQTYQQTYRSEDERMRAHYQQHVEKMQKSRVNVQPYRPIAPPLDRDQFEREYYMGGPRVQPMMPLPAIRTPGHTITPYATPNGQIWIDHWDDSGMTTQY